MDVSIVLTTFRRLPTLRPTLESLTRLDLKGISCEIVVVDNADDPETQACLAQYEARLPLRWMVETRPGQNAARNRALPLLSGKIIVPTDDDVIAEPDWIRKLIEGTARWPGHSIFTGRILASEPIPFDTSHDLIRSAFMVGDWPQPEGPIRPDCVWGPNMAFRRDLFDQGHRFSENIGTQGKDYAMGSEIEFVLRMTSIGHRSIYLPDAVVKHQIRPEQFDPDWLCGRAFRSGRGVAALYGLSHGPAWFGVPRYLYREVPEKAFKAAYWQLRGDPQRALLARLQHWHARGKAKQYRMQRKRTAKPGTDPPQRAPTP